MKNKSKNISIVSIFIIITVITLFFFVSLLIGKFTDTLNFYVNNIIENNITEMKVGEKVEYYDINKEFEYSFESTHTDHFIIANQSVENVMTGEKLDIKPIYLDENGFVTAYKPGIYELRYNILNGYNENGLKKGKKLSGKSYYNTIIVYPDDNYEFEEFPEDYSKFDNKKSYILKSDIILDNKYIAKLNADDFYGIIYNPDNYIFYEQSTFKHSPSIFENNKGMLINLKFKFSSDENNCFESGFYGITKNNFGLIKDCSIEGNIFVGYKMINTQQIENAPCCIILPQMGFVIDNTAKVSVYSDYEIMPYNEFKNNFKPKGENVATYNYLIKDNKIEAESYYNTDLFLSRRRNIFNNISNCCEVNIKNNNFINNLDSVYESKENYKINLKIKVSKNSYNEKIIEFNKNQHIDLGIYNWEEILPDYMSNPNLEVLYWLVDGIKYDNLNDILVKNDITIEPYVKHKRTERFFTDSNNTLYQIFSVDDVVHFSTEKDIEEDNPILLDSNLLFFFFNSPYNIMPSQIIIDKNCISEKNNVLYNILNDESAELLYDYIKNGGIFTIDKDNKDIAFLDNRMLLNQKGKKLERYFPLENESVVNLHPQINIIGVNAFFVDKEIEEIYFDNILEFEDDCFSKTTFKKIHFGKNIDSYTSFTKLLKNCKNLSQIDIDENNEKIYSVDNFIIKKDDNCLIFIPPNLTGTVYIPNGVKQCNYRCFYNDSDIEELVFPENFQFLSSVMISQMKNLRKLNFLDTDSLNIYSASYGGEIFNSLQTVVFSDNIKELNISESVFGDVNLNTIKLPKNIEYIFRLCNNANQFEIDESNQYYYTKNGVLFSKNNNQDSLIAYPRFKSDEIYNIPDGINSINYSAFYNTKNIKQVVLPESLKEIYDSGFSYSSIEKINLNNVNSLMFMAFYYCSDLKEVNIEKLTSLGRMAFSNSGITKVVNNNIKSINEYAFDNCKNLEYAELKNVLFLNQCAFNNCENLKTIILADNISLSSKCFSGCKNLLEFNSIITTTGKNVFDGCEKLKVLNYKTDNIIFSNDTIGNISQEIKLYVDVDKDTEWEGKINPNFILYVREDAFQDLNNKWLHNENQLISYNYEKE